MALNPLICCRTATIALMAAIMAACNQAPSRATPTLPQTAQLGFPGVVTAEPSEEADAGTGALYGSEALRGVRWAGVAWHSLFIFDGETGTMRVSRLPETDDSFSAVFDFCVDEDGLLWFPNSQMNFESPMVVVVDPDKSAAAVSVIRFQDTVPGPGASPFPPVPFNVAVDGEWLYVLRKYCLVESRLTRISLQDQSDRSDLLLPADGGGIGSQLALGRIGGKQYLGLVLNRSFCLVDTDAWKVLGSVNDERCATAVSFSTALESFVMVGTGEEHEFVSSAEAGEYAVFAMTGRDGKTYYSIHRPCLWGWRMGSLRSGLRM
jgi:hypothetical protein